MAQHPDAQLSLHQHSGSGSSDNVHGRVQRVERIAKALSAWIWWAVWFVDND